MNLSSSCDDDSIGRFVMRAHRRAARERTRAYPLYACIYGVVSSLDKRPPSPCYLACARICPESNARTIVNGRAMMALLFSYSTSGVLDHALNLSISLSAGKETKWDSPSNGE